MSARFRKEKISWKKSAAWMSRGDANTGVFFCFLLLLSAASLKKDPPK
jgi:hypothetical protein